MEHVFISYVRENSEAVDDLAGALRKHGINVWLDRDQIDPGRPWKDATTEAIRRGAFFIACFSPESQRRQRSFMNEELNLAIEELRLRPQTSVWFIPLRLGECDVPAMRITAARSLRDLQWLDFFPDRGEAIRRILAVIRQHGSVEAGMDENRLGAGAHLGSVSTGGRSILRKAARFTFLALALVLLAYLASRALPKPGSKLDFHPPATDASIQSTPGPKPQEQPVKALDSEKDRRAEGAQEGTAQTPAEEEIPKENTPGEHRTEDRRSPSADDSEESELVFPSVVDAIHAGNFAAVPDDQVFRRYIVSFFKGLIDSCGAAPPADAMAATEYGFPQTRNPYAYLGEMFKAIVEYRDTGSPSGLAELNEAFLGLGVEDGSAFALTHKCNSWKTRQLRTRLGELMRQRRSTEPEPYDRERALALMHPNYREIVNDSVSSMMSIRSRRESLYNSCRRDTEMGEPYLGRFCTCMVEAIFKSDVSSSHQDALIQDFSHETRGLVENENPRFAEQWQHCRQ